MTRGAGVLRRVAVRRGIAAARRAARLAGAQVNPARADLHALLTFVCLGGANVFHRVDVRTGSRLHRSSIARSQRASVAAALYVDRRNASSVSSGESAVLTAW